MNTISSSGLISGADALLRFRNFQVRVERVLLPEHIDKLAVMGIAGDVFGGGQIREETQRSYATLARPSWIVIQHVGIVNSPAGRRPIMVNQVKSWLMMWSMSARR